MTRMRRVLPIIPHWDPLSDCRAVLFTFDRSERGRIAARSEMISNEFFLADWAIFTALMISLGVFYRIENETICHIYKVLRDSRGEKYVHSSVLNYSATVLMIQSSEQIILKSWVSEEVELFTKKLT